MKIQIARDSEGYLVNPDDWNHAIAVALAKEEGLELNDEYWPVLNFMRNYYNEYGIIPDIRHAANYLAKDHGYGKKEAKNNIFKLFPYGYVKQACKIAGMKRPRAWSTG